MMVASRSRCSLEALLHRRSSHRGMSSHPLLVLSVRALPSFPLMHSNCWYGIDQLRCHTSQHDPRLQGYRSVAFMIHFIIHHSVWLSDVATGSLFFQSLRLTRLALYSFMRALLCLMMEDISVAKARIVRLSGDVILSKTRLSRAAILFFFFFFPLPLLRIPTAQHVLISSPLAVCDVFIG
ncbi:hypothetical protein BDW72DRAFT_125238 [Aspergillus terricola var. indicus]